jgi:hypothetical protein
MVPGGFQAFHIGVIQPAQTLNAASSRSVYILVSTTYLIRKILGFAGTTAEVWQVREAVLGVGLWLWWQMRVVNPASPRG